jgi:hypothetical protein
MKELAREVLSIFLVIALASVSLVGCFEDIDGDEDYVEAPPLPPEESMNIDMSIFIDYEPLAGSNFKNAAVRMVAINTSVAAILAAPAAVFAAAISTVPKQQQDGSWLWSYTTTVLGNRYEANLTSRTEMNKNIWSMRVTSTAPELQLDNFEWYIGESSRTNTSGSWTFFDIKTPDERNQVGTVDWRVATVTIGFPNVTYPELVLTNTNSRSEYFGDVTSYRIEYSTATISYYDASEDLTSYITWDLDTYSGSIKVPNYNNGEVACWDENLQDIECPQ